MRIFSSEFRKMAHEYVVYMQTSIKDKKKNLEIVRVKKKNVKKLKKNNETIRFFRVRISFPLPFLDGFMVRLVRQ